MLNPDFSKIYGITDSLYNVFEPYLLLPDSLPIFTKEKEYKREFKKKKVREEVKVNISIATTEELKKLRGIGEAYSKRIVKYREKLGGFYSKEQLSEVYGVSDSLYNSLLPNIYVSDSIMTKIDINTSSVYKMSKHPYITWNMGLLIENYRKENGNYSSVSILKSSGLFNAELYSKIAPYLTVGE